MNSRHHGTPRIPPPLSFWLLLLAFLPSLAARAYSQAPRGVWQATLPTGSEPRRIVLNVVSGSNGALSGSLDFIDRGPVGAPLLSPVFIAPELRFAVGDITFNGQLAPGGTTIAGTWTRAGQTLPLTFTRADPNTLWTYAGPAALGLMPPSADPSFEVATIKPSRPDEQTGIPVRSRRFHTTGTTVTDLIRFAYHLQPRQLQGGPAWRDQLRFDLAAEPDLPGQPSVAQQRSMVRKLLRERFGLVTHETDPVLSTYALVRTGTEPLQPSQPGELTGSIYPHDTGAGETAVQFAFMSMPEFTDILMNFISDRQIVDATHLPGQFDFALLLPTSLVHGEQGPDVPDKAAAFLAALPRAGFRLVRTRQPVQVLVIEALRPPTPN